MTAACGQDGDHAPHTYQDGMMRVLVGQKPTDVPKMVLCNGKDS